MFQTFIVISECTVPSDEERSSGMGVQMHRILYMFKSSDYSTFQQLYSFIITELDSFEDSNLPLMMPASTFFQKVWLQNVN